MTELQSSELPTTKRELAAHCSRLLVQIADKRRRANRLQGELNKKVASLQEDYGKRIETHKDAEKKLIDALLSAALPNFAQLVSPGTRTIKLRSGEVALRDNPGAIEVTDEAAAINYLRRRGLLGRYTRVKRTLDKTALKKNLKLLLRLPGVTFTKGTSVVLRPMTVQGEIVVEGDSLSVPLPELSND